MRESSGGSPVNPVAIDIDEATLFEALNDPAMAEELMSQRGWTTEDLLSRAEELNSALVESMSSVKVV